MKTVILNCTVCGYLKNGHYELDLDDERWEKFNSLDEEDKIDYIRNWGNMVIDNWSLEDCFPDDDFEVYDNNENKSN